MLKQSEVNLLAIITPHNTHAPLALQCLKAGRHVVCEKPMAITTAECDAMIAAAKKNKVVLSTYHNRHWDGIILGAMQHIRKGAIGDIVRVDAAMAGWGKPGDWWRTSKKMSGGIVYDWGVHILEYTLQIVRSEIVEVNGFMWSGIWAPFTKWKKDTFEDDALITVRYASGAWSTLAMSNIESRGNPHFIKVTGTKGTLVMNWNASEIVTHQNGKTISTSIPNPHGEGWKLYQNIADHMTKGTKLVITAEWARRPIHILDLANQSSKLGKALKARYR